MVNMTATLLLGALAALADGQLIDATVECPVGVETRIVFPEAVIELRTPAAAVVRALHLRVVASSPKAILSLAPVSTPLEALVVFEGPTTTLRVQVRAIATGTAQEVRLPGPAASSPAPPTVPARAIKTPGSATSARAVPRAVARMVPPSLAPAPPPPAARPETALTPSAVPPEPAADAEVVVLRPVWVATPTPTSAPTPQAIASPPTGTPAAGSTGRQPATSSFDAAALALARPQRIGREEGLPGRPAVVLEDALHSASLVWLRFRVPGGAKWRVDSVRWERGDLDVMVVPDGKDLRVVVQLPRREVSKHTRVEIRLAGETYKFPVSAPWFSTFLRSLF